MMIYVILYDRVKKNNTKTKTKLQYLLTMKMVTMLDVILFFCCCFFVDQSDSFLDKEARGTALKDLCPLKRTHRRHILTNAFGCW